MRNNHIVLCDRLMLISCRKNLNDNTFASEKLISVGLKQVEKQQNGIRTFPVFYRNGLLLNLLSIQEKKDFDAVTVEEPAGRGTVEITIICLHNYD